MDSSLSQLQVALGDAYLIEREVGGDGMRRVVLATEASRKRRVAIVVLPPEQAGSVNAARFAREIELAAHLQHPHILPIRAAGARGDLRYYVTPYVEGESLRHRLTREGPLPVGDAARFLEEIADALEYAHLRGVVHGDISAEHILLEGDHAVLTDLGVAGAIAAGDRHIDARADIDALAAVGYEMLAGVPPFGGATPQAVRADEPPDLHAVRPDVPVALAQAIATGLARDPSARFAGAAAFRDAVEAGAGRLAARPRPRVPTLLGVAAALVVALGSGIVWYWRVHHPPRVDADTVVVAPFDVRDDRLALWHEGMVDVLARDLDGAGPLRTVAPSTGIGRWSGRSDRRSAVALGRATGAGLAIYGSISASGPDSVHASATLVNVVTGRPLGDVDAQDADSHIDRMCDSLTVQLLRELGRSRRWTAVGRGESMGSSSPAAIAAYLQGEHWVRVSNWDSALVSYDRAIGLDSAFALAWAASGLVHGWQRGGDDAISLSYGLRAGALNRGLAPRDSLLITVDSLMSAIRSGADPHAWTDLGRSFATIGAAIQRYPTDPGVWYFEGELREHFGMYRGHYYTSAQVLDAFDRSIAGDSLFAPAYLHPIERALSLDDEPLARRYIAAYTAQVPNGAAAGGVRLIEALVDPGATDAARDSVLEAASSGELVQAQASLGAWPDPAEWAIQSLELLNAPGRQPPGSPRDSLGLRVRLAMALAARGHVDSALAVAATIRAAFDKLAPPWEIFNGALVGILSRDSANAVAARLLAGRKPSVAYALPWWSFTGDTMALKTAVRVFSRSIPGRVTQAAAAALALGASEAPAFLALARHDSASALRELAMIPDSLCVDADCDAATLTQAQLLAAAGRQGEALRILPPRNALFGSLLMVPNELLRARLLEAQGERAGALDAYVWVTKVWRSPDPALRAFVAEARNGIRRLRGERGPAAKRLGADR